MSYKFLSWGIAAGILIPNIVLAEQAILQQGSTNATAIGNNNHVGSRVHQSATQSQSNNPNAYINQQGQSNAAATGNHNSVISNIEQNSRQQGNYGDNTNQSGVQNATNNATAIGNNNKITNNNRQYSRQGLWRY